MPDRKSPFAKLLRPLFVALACVATGASAAVRDASDGLSIERGQGTQRRGAEILHPLRVDRRRFEAMGRGAVVDLPSTGNAPQRARFHRSERRGGDFTWIGKVDTEHGPQSAVITFGEDAVFGTIPQPKGPPLRIESRRGKPWLVEGELIRHMRKGSKDDARIPARAGGIEGEPPPSAAAATSSTGGPLVDVLVAYTPSMVTRYGSTSAVLSRLTYLEALTNQAYADTPANIRIRVVARNLLNYTAATSNGTLLDLITNPSSNTIKQQIDAWRQQTGADLVVVVRSFDVDTQDDCGTAWIGGYHGSTFSPSYGFATVGDGSDGGYYCVDQTFAHELGHTMGSHHDIDTAGGDYGAYPYSRGYRRTLNSASGFATVMAYSDGPQTQLNVFSNPALAQCLGQPCGVANSSDNARALTNAAAKVAAYRSGSASTPVPTLSVANASVAEGDSGARSITFRVSLSAPASSSVSFTVSTANGSATAGSDYTSLAATRVTLAAGTTTRDIAVSINGDTAPEPDETFAFNLSSPSGATIADGTATGTISNDDAAASLSIADAAVVEGSSGTRTMNFTVRLSQASTVPVTYTVATYTNANTTATAGADFQAVSATRTIPAGTTTQVVPVTIVGDTQAEADETFIVYLSKASGATIANSAALGIVRDDDAAATTLSIGDVSVMEGDSGATYAKFTIQLSQPAPTRISFDIATVASGTATAGTDYTPTGYSGATFSVGARAVTFQVPVRGDTTGEPSEWFVVRVGKVVGAQVTDALAVGRIVNDD